MSSAIDETRPAPISRRELRIAFSGLLLTLTVAALDQNIVGTALPRIVSDLGGLAHLSWVVTAFLLASTTTTPLYGKLSDLYGRRPLFFAAILIFLVGSMLCGAAGSMTQLILFRGVQGLGAGGLISLSQITIADLVSPRERGRYQGLFGAVFAICSIAGPLLGGFLTDVLSWRWIFYVNLPIGAAALLLITIGLPRTSRHVVHRIDFLGAMWLSGATVCLLLVLSWGGAVYPWLSPLVIGLAIAAVVLSALFIFQERVASEPIVPLRLFADRVFVVSVAAIGLTSTALMGAFVFLPAFFQLVLGVSPSTSGLMTAPLMAGLILASVAGGRIVSATGRYKLLPVIGLVVAIVAFLALAIAIRTGGGGLVIEVTLPILGAGLGLVMPNLTVAIQNAVERTDIGVATSASSYFRSLGGALGVAAAGAVMTSALSGFSAAIGEAASSLSQIAQLPPATREAFTLAYRNGIATTFFAATAVSVFTFLIILMLPDRPLRSTREAVPREAAAAHSEG
jgi:EmrB/QacA subfamily drug resistance transporter